MSAVIINNFEIINNGQQLAIDVETIPGSIINSLSLWDIDSFKDDSLAINLSYKLKQINNREVLIIDAEEIPRYSFTDIYFIEVKSNYIGDEGCETCRDPALGITYNLQPYYRCMLNYLTEGFKSSNCGISDVSSNNLTITVNLLIDGIEKSLDIGFYLQAIEMINQLKKLCSISKCKNCETIECKSCSKFVVIPQTPILPT